MKYLKKYKDINIKIGKYFLVGIDSDQINKVKSKLIKILNYNIWKYNFLILGFDNNFFRLTLSENNIIRELTPEEIEEFEMKIDAKKYNL